jgi:hypothetical protein
LGVRAGWLAFGEGPASGEPKLPSSLDPPLPDAVAGANHLRAAQRAEHEAAVAKRKRRKKRG